MSNALGDAARLRNMSTEELREHFKKVSDEDHEIYTAGGNRTTVDKAGRDALVEAIVDNDLPMPWDVDQPPVVAVIQREVVLRGTGCDRRGNEVVTFKRSGNDDVVECEAARGTFHTTLSNLEQVIELLKSEEITK